LESFVIEKGIQCLIVGMGKTAKNPTLYPLVLQKAPQRYSSRLMAVFGKLQAMNILFHTQGDNGESGCSGDSGGPLYCG
jgi:secreted trypsin-like serine protease